jgi:hypothetical protein
MKDNAKVSVFPAALGCFSITRYKGSRHWAIHDGAGVLVCVTVYKKGAKEVARRLRATISHTPPTDLRVRERTPEMSAMTDTTIGIRAELLALLRERFPTLVPKIRFVPGRIVITPGAKQALEENRDTAEVSAEGNAHNATDILTYLIRHLTGDWGKVEATDRQANEDALKTGARILSAYSLPDGQTLWLLTEADRSATTAMLPDEY